MRPELSQAVSQMREILTESDFTDEGHRKASLRRVLHAAASGRSMEEIDELVDQLRQRFPDRSYETATLARQLEREKTDLVEQLAEAQRERDSLQSRLSELEPMIENVWKTATQLQGGRVATGGAALHANRSPEKLAPLFSALEDVLRFAAQQESIAQTVDGGLTNAGGADGRPVPELLARLAKAEGSTDAELEQLRTRLGQLGLAPAAMMAGVQQSWTGGTTGILEYLDPTKVEESIPQKLPGLRDVAVLKELRNRFQDFWARLDDNVAHYYRGTFERVYREKMEERR